MPETTAIAVRTDTLGRVALLSVLAEDPQCVIDHAPGYRVVLGQVGTMDVQKIIAAIEALYGITRGQIALGALLRTVGLRFSLVRGPRLSGDPTTWVAVALYGTIGQPVKGMEHEVVGLGVFHTLAA